MIAIRTNLKSYKETQSIPNVESSFPAHWKPVPLKYCVNLINDKIEELDEDLKYIGLENIEGWTARYSPNETQKIEGASNSFVKGDVLFGKLRPYLAKVYLAEFPGICSSEALVLRCKEFVNEHFLKYFLLSNSTISKIDSSTYGAKMPRASWDFIGNLLFVLPTSAEQQAIVNFLDKRTTQIDNLIEQKEKLFKLLTEKRTAIITQAVTKGFNPKVKMKDSGIEWLGEIPEGWKVARIKFIGSIRYGLGEPPPKKVDGLPFVRATDIKRGKIVEDDIQYIDPDFVPWSKKPILKENEILVVRSGAYTGDSAIVPRQLEGAIAGYDMVLNCTSAHPAFVAYALLSPYLLHAQIFNARNRAAQPHLNAEELGNFLIILPSMEEQIAIVARLTDMLFAIERSIDKISFSIEKLKEYRKALITSAVTGQIDVRKEIVV